MKSLIKGYSNAITGTKHVSLPFLGQSLLKTDALQYSKWRYLVIGTKKKEFQWLPFVDIDFRNMCFLTALVFRMSTTTSIIQFMIAGHSIGYIKDC